MIFCHRLGTALPDIRRPASLTDQSIRRNEWLPATMALKGLERLRSADFQPKARPPQIPKGRLAFPTKRAARAIEAQWCLEATD
jgi:hypothetical protein